MTIGIAPITGIPLPFVSVGGSSMISNLVGMGILQAIHARGGRRRGPVQGRSQAAGAAQAALGRPRGARGVGRRPAARDRRRPRARAPAREGAAGRRRRRAVREHGRAEGAAALVWIGVADEDALRKASAAGVPIVGVTEGESLPYVLDTEPRADRPRRGAFPVDEIARALAAGSASGVPGSRRACRCFGTPSSTS